MSFPSQKNTFIVVYPGAVCTAESVEKNLKHAATRQQQQHLFTTQEEVKRLLFLLFPENWTTLRMSKSFILTKPLMHVYTHHDQITLIRVHVNSEEFESLITLNFDQIEEILHT